MSSLYRFTFSGQLLVDDSKGVWERDGLEDRVKTALQDQLRRSVGAGVAVDLQEVKLVQPKSEEKP